MPNISEDQLKRHNQMLAALETDRSQWLTLWKELSNNYLPQRYRWLMSAKEYYSTRARRQYIINNTGTQAARTLAAGMMNGTTSPSRPWFKLRIHGINLDRNRDLAIWLEEVERVLLKIMAESNFYNSMAVMYLDMIVFGTGVVLIYPDRESVIRCYNPPLGEFYLANSSRMQVNRFARKFTMTIYQYVERWPDRRYWSDRVKNAVDQKSNNNMMQDVEISHFLGPNDDGLVPKSMFPYYEMYWETRRQQTGSMPQALELRGFHELPGIFARWEMSGGDAYGVGPGMDALGDNIELQHLHRNKAELLEKTHKPPTMVDVMLQNDPLAIMPGGVTYVPGLNNATVGAKPIFTVQPRFDQINIDQKSIEERIKDTFFNFLFTGATDLQTVRSATEINAREAEKLILLGGVLERLESEGFDPGISRIFSIAERAGLLPPPPPQYDNLELEIQYVSILSVAQRAVGTAPTERLLGLLGNLAAVLPQTLDIPNFDRLIRNYALDVGVRQSELKSEDEVNTERQQKNAALASQAALDAGNSLSQSARNLSQADVGGGTENLLKRLMGPGG